MKKSKKSLAVFFSAFLVTVCLLAIGGISWASWNNTATWTTQNDFESNANTTGTSTSPSFVDTASSSGSVKLIKPTDIGNTMAGGGNFSLIVKNDGTVWGSGQNTEGQLGKGDLAGTDKFVQVASDGSSVYAGYKFSFILKKDGTLWAAGDNSAGQLGLGDNIQRTSWTQTASDVKLVAAGYSYAIILKTDGSVWSTGTNSSWQLGLTNSVARNSWSQVTNSNIVKSADSEVVSIAAGWNTSYAVKSDGKLFVIGSRVLGATGDGTTANVLYTTWTQAAALSGVNIVKVAACFQGFTPLALASDGTVWGAGQNATGQLGLDSAASTPTWTQNNMTNVVDISIGLNQSVILKNDNTIWIAGAMSGVSHYTFTQIGSNDYTGVAAGTSHFMARKKDGTVVATGQNYYGQLGNSNDLIYTGDWQNINLTNVSMVASGYMHQFALKSDGTLWGTGYNSSNGELGLVSSTTNKYGFLRIPITDVSKVLAGQGNSIALKSDGTVWIAGYFASAINPWTQAAGLSGITDIGLGNGYGSAVKSDGTVWSYGLNSAGQLGTNDKVNKSSWTQATGVTTATKVSSGYSSSFIVTSNGELWSTGDNTYGQLGLGDKVAKTVYTKSTTISDVAKVWAGDGYHTIIQKTDGTVWGVGQNTNGELGTGDYTDRTAWTQLSDFTGAISVSTNIGKTFILKSDHTLWASGTNTYGEFGNGTIYQKRNTFVQIASDVQEMSVGTRQSIILKTDGSVYTAGFNGYGGLGILVSDNAAHYNFESVLTNAKRNLAYYDTGHISNLQIDAGENNIGKWNTISWTGTVPENTVIKFRTRGSTTEAGLADATWSDYYTSSGSAITTSSSRWLEVEATLYSSDGLNTPALDSVSVNYYTDTTPPTNPTATSAWTDSDKAASINADTFVNDTKPYFEFSGATDETGGSGIKEYYIYFGTSNSADPYTAGTKQSQAEGDTQSFTPTTSLTADGTYYLRVRTIDNAGNRSEPITLFTYKLDKTAPVSPSLINVSPFSWSLTNKFTFNWTAGNDEANYASGLAGYQYKLGDGDWSGTITDLSVANIESYQDGKNTFYIRSIDNAGNTGDIKQAYYYYNGQAPSAPQNLTVNPQSSTTANSFTFEWDKPAHYNGEIKGYRYSINALPQANNTTFLDLSKLPPEASYDPDTGHFILADIPAAVSQGDNYFYIVAIDTNDNVAYGDTGARIGFSCTTPAPGTPVNVEIFDTSNRDLAKYSVAIGWTAPKDKGVGFKDYVIEKSLDGENFSVLGYSAGTSFIDSDLENINYSYRILTRDNSGNTSVPSAIVSITPTGKYTSPPVITVEPEVSAKVTTASIRWVTDRAASSFVAASESADFDPTKNQQGQQDSTVEHIVQLSGLKPDTIYHYKVIYTDEDGNSNVKIAEDHIFRTQPAPRVEQVSTKDIRLHTAIISWYTSEPATSDILYGKNSSYSHELDNVSGGATTVHSIRLEDLDDSSTYHFAIRINDADGNIILSDDYSFDTLMYPKISNIRFEPVTDQSTSAFKISWTTNVPTNSVIEYQLEGGSKQESVKTALELKHEITITNLLDNKYYLINATGSDQYGNIATSDIQRVKTDYDTRPPAVTDLTTEVTNSEYGTSAKSQIIVSWETDEPSTSQVEYGLGVTGDNYDIKTQEDATLTTSHVIIVSGLRPSSAYHLRAVSKDESGNRGVSASQSILTEQSRSSVLDIIINSLQSSIGWLFGGKS